jgi:hypothetical protein
MPMGLWCRLFKRIQYLVNIPGKAGGAIIFGLILLAGILYTNRFLCYDVANFARVQVLTYRDPPDEEVCFFCPAVASL